MLYESEITSPHSSVYQQHQYLDDLFAQVGGDERQALIAQGKSPARDYSWCEADGTLYVRRARPTNELPWYPVAIPPTDTMINFELTARCRRNVLDEMRRDDQGNVVPNGGTRTPLREPSDCLDWLERIAQFIGLEIVDAEVDEIAKWIGKITNSRRFGQHNGFYLLGSHFAGVATVTDRTLFERALIRGIGDSKAFGFGFMFFWQRGLHHGS